VPVLLPIFPLEVVLFPGIPLPLHIFEPRYQEMIGECLQQKKPFGIVRAQKEGIAELGCTAEIVELLKRYDDGRMDIMTVGRRRFELVEVNRDRNFLQAQVLFIDDEPEGTLGITPAARERALELFSEVAELIGQEQDVDSGSRLLSFQLAGTLPIDLDFKQALLAIRSEAERLAGLTEFFEAILPKLKKAARRRDKAGGNGHVL
jgi:Lon protease-like protein